MMDEGDSKKRKLVEEGNNKVEQLQPHSLRCDEANVKVIVGEEQQEEEEKDDDDEGNNKGDGSINNKETTTTTTTKKVFWHYSHILAFHSRYVDTLLSAPLAAASAEAEAEAASTVNKDTNKKSRKSKDANNNNNANDINDEDDTNITITEISFPDISPSNWERMINFVTDPVATRKMSVEDAMELVGMYDKYDFHTGIKLCDEILSSVFIQDEYNKFQNRTMQNMELLDRCVQVVVLSHEKNLKQTLTKGMNWLVKILWFCCEPECVILTVDHIRKLVPAIACCKDDEVDIFECSVGEAIGFRLSDTSIDILNPMFPAFFVSQIRLIVAQNTTLKLVNQIKISNCTQGRVPGIYNAMTDENGEIERSCFYVKYNREAGSSINLTRNEVGDWTIEELDNEFYRTLLFICEGSRCEILPPKTGWKRIAGVNDFNQRNLPILSYYHNDGTGRREVEI